MNNHNNAVFRFCQGLTLTSCLLAMSLPAIARGYDLNGDGSADLVWRHDSGQNYQFLLDKQGKIQGQEMFSVSPDWNLALVADFDADGKTDTLWTHRKTGQAVLLLQDGASIRHELTLPVSDPAWVAIAAPDLQGDGSHDIVWRHQKSGQIYVYQMDKGKLLADHSLFSVGFDWSLEAVADTNADGHDDLIWRNLKDGDLYIHQMQGQQILGQGAVARIDLNWQIAGSGDVDLDGNEDLLFRHTGTGQNAVVRLNGTQMAGVDDLPTVAAEWQLAMVADVNQDSRPDLVWHHAASGSNYLWLMQGAQASEVNLGQTAPGWAIQGTKKLVNMIQGKQRFTQVCATCHGADAQGGAVKISLIGCSSCSDVSSLADRIARTMSANVPGGCDAQCSVEVASYLMAQYNAQPPKPVEPPVGENLYLAQCASCHAADGQGIFGQGPSLVACPSCSDLSSLVSRIDRTMPLANPEHCTGSCAEQTASYILQHFNQALDSSGLQQLTQASAADTLYRASLALAGRVPTATETSQVTADPNRLAAAIDVLLNEEAFYQRLIEGYNDLLLTDKYLPWESALNLLNSKDYPNRFWYRVPDLDTSVDTPERAQYYKLMKHANEGTAREPLELIKFIVRNNRPFSEILTADYMMVNYASAKVFAVDSQLNFDLIPGTENDTYPQYDPAIFKQARMSGFPHAGILTSPMFLNRYPTTSTNRNRQRAKVVFDFFLDTDILAIGGNRPATTDVLAEANPTLDNPACYGCHSVLDPVASIFQNFNNQGMYRLSRLSNSWASDMEARGFAGVTMPLRGNQDASERWLAAEMVKDPRFAKAAVSNAYRILFGRPVLKSGGSSEAERQAYLLQRSYLAQIEQKFIQNNFNLKLVFRELALSPYFRAQGLGQAQADLHAQTGSARLLPPELLQRKINSVVGFNFKKYSWSGDSRLLEQDFRLLFGGIDSDSVTKRMGQINGVMTAVSNRSSYELACQAMYRDFFLPAAQRSLFPLVATNTAPNNADGTAVPSNQELIKKNIQYLHQRALGEQLSLSDPELLATYKLFMDVFNDGQKLIAASSKNKNLPDACRLYNHPVTGERLTSDQEITRDDYYILRSWMAVLAYLFADYRFIHQ